VNKKLGKILAFKLGPTLFQAEVDRLRAEGRMPTLPELLDVIAEDLSSFVVLLRCSRYLTSRSAGQTRVST
jgi:hypothetical protein